MRIPKCSGSKLPVSKYPWLDENEMKLIIVLSIFLEFYVQAPVFQAPFVQAPVVRVPVVRVPLVQRLLVQGPIIQ